MAMRSALPKENGQLTMGCAVTRLVTLPRRPRARNTDNRVPSATETRAIEALAPSSRAFLCRRGGTWRRAGQRPPAVTRSNPLQTGGVEAVEAAHARIRVAQVAGKRPRGAVRRPPL